VRINNWYSDWLYLQGINQPFIPLGFGANQPQDMHNPRSSSASPMRASAAFGLPGTNTPEIQKYKKRFNTDILCAALWGMSDFQHSVYCE